MTISNNKISNLVDSQVPFFVRNDHQTFVTFLKKYYEFMEQDEGATNVIKNIKDYRDIDYTIEDFENELYKQFLVLLPKDVSFDKNLLLKHVKDLYRARGTEKSIRFLLSALYRIETDFYYPKTDILRVSDGKWFIEKSLKITDIRRNGVPDSSQETLQLFGNTRVCGISSNASAAIERVESYYENGVYVDELRVSSQINDFDSGETIQTEVEINGEFITLTANIFAGIIATVDLSSPGTGYTVGMRPTIINTSANGSGGIIEVTAISNGSINSVGVIYAGAGYKANDSLLFVGSGSGARGNVFAVLDNSTVHPNSYNIFTSTISLEANTLIGNTLYTNLNASNANTTLINSWSSFVYSNTGPILALAVADVGTDYSTVPMVEAQANTMVRSLGILGRMEIIDGGMNYQKGNKIEFIGGLGTGASGNVKNVSVTGAITQVEFELVPGNFVGGQGYSQSALPSANVISATGNGANIVVTAILGESARLQATTDSLGAIRGLTILDGGTGYDAAPLLDFSAIGNGDAAANASVVTGVYTYPGRYLNDDGHISGYNFIEDRDYYQLFSYVIRTNRSINDYRSIIDKLVHPAGTKMFGEYLQETPHFETEGETEFQSATSNVVIQYTANTDQMYLYGKRYTGDFSPTNNLAFFATATIETDQETNEVFVASSANTNYSWQWLGFFYAPVTGNYTFVTRSDDASFVWLGANAKSNWTTSNALVSNGGSHAAQNASGVIALTEGILYPMRVVYGQGTGVNEMLLGFTDPIGTYRANGYGYYYGGRDLWDELY